MEVNQLLLEIIENQKKMIELMEVQISMTAAAAIADPLTGIDPHSRQNAAVFAKKAFSNRYKRMNPAFWD